MSSRNKPDRKVSALSELDSKLDQLRNGGLELESITPAEVYADLLSGLWWRACAEAVTEQPERLLGWYRGTDEEIGDLLRGQAGSVEAGEVGLAVARAIAAVGVVSASAVGRVSSGHAEQAVSVAVSAWSKANLLTDTSLDETAAHVGDDASPALQAALAIIADAPPSTARAYAMVMAGEMSPTSSGRRRKRSVRVLFDTSTAGVTGMLTLRVVSQGPPGLFPDPEAMAFLSTNPAFALALTAAWRNCSAEQSSPMPCVLWSLSHEGDRLSSIQGRSLGAAFAVALADLVRSRGARLWSSRILQGFSGATAITGTVAEDGSIGRVGGLDRKFAIALQRNWSVVAPAENEADGNVPAGLNVHWVSTVGQARTRALRWVRWKVATAIAVVLGLGFGAAAWGFVGTQIQTAKANADNERKQKLVLTLLTKAAARRDNDPVVALRLGLAALATQSYDETRAGLVDTLTAGRPSTAVVSGHGNVRAVAFGPDGLLLTGDGTGAALWNVSTFNQPRRLSVLAAAEPIQAAAMSRDGHVVLTVADTISSGVEVWDTTDPGNPRLIYKIATCAAMSVAVNTNRSIALVGCAAGTVELWDISNRTRAARVGVLTLGSVAVRSVALNHEGTIAVVGSDRGLAVWDITELSHARSITSAYTQIGETEPSGSFRVPRPVYSVAADSTGSSVLAGGDGGWAQVARNAKGDHVVRGAALGMDSYTGNVDASALSDDGALALTSGANNSVVVWQRGEQPEGDPYVPKILLSKHTAPVISLAVSPDGRTAITGSKDGSARLWNLSTPDLYKVDTTMQRLASGVTKLTCSYHTTLCATVDGDGLPVLWDIADPVQPQRLGGLRESVGSAVNSIGFAPNANWVAVGTADGRAVLLDVDTPRTPLPIATFQVGHGPVQALALSPDGKAVAVGGDDGEVSLWEMSGPQRRTTLVVPTGQGKAVRAIAIDGDGRWLATGGDDGEVTVIDISDRARPTVLTRLPPRPGKVRALSFQPGTRNLLQANDTNEPPIAWNLSVPTAPTTAMLAGAQGMVNSLAYNRSGSMAITVSDDDTATVWNVVDAGKPAVLARLVGHKSSVAAGLFSAEGGTVITGSTDGSVITWNIEVLTSITRDPRPTACEVAHGAFTLEEWPTWVSPEVPYVNNC